MYFLKNLEFIACLLSLLGINRIGDNKKVSQIEMLPDEQLLVLISGRVHDVNTCMTIQMWVSVISYFLQFKLEKFSPVSSFLALTAHRR